DLDTRIDVYASGVIIYETLLGVVPHRADNYNALLIEIITEDAAPFRYMRPDIPPRLEAAVLKALARSRDDRWPTAVDLMEELVAIRREIPVSALHGTPVLGEKIEPVDRNSATLDISEIPATHRGAVSQLAFETGGGTIQPPARTRMAKAAGWVVGSVLLIGLIALGFVWLFESEGEVNPPPTTRAATPDGEGGDKPQGDRSTSILLAVSATPHDATVIADGELVPEAGIHVARGNIPIELRVEAEGFETRTLEVVPVADLDLEVALDPIPEPDVDTSAQPSTELTSATSGKGGKGKGGKGGKGGGKKPPKGQEPKPPDKPGDKPPKKPGDKPPKKPDNGHSLDRPMDNPF
ncbi:MAG: hypothetical protein JRF63_08905, partial [Deltaproteobacteria bacterium]|nr:hypothetical protein [Deltaproteobacteria bacterium]